MTTVAIKDLKGKQVGERQLSDYVFGAPANKAVVHQALLRQLANARSGSANSKTRSEVRGGGRKPWRQKGTGRARAGSIRSPLWAGGGVIFGPKPRDYSLDMNKKARKLALRSMLSSRLADMSVLKSFDNFGDPKTKVMAALLSTLGLADKTVLIILDTKAEGSQLIERSARNIDTVKVIDYTNLNVKDLAYADAVVTTETVVEQIEKRFSKEGCSSAPCTDEKAAPKAKAKASEAAPAKAKATKAAAEPKAEGEAKPKAAKKKKTEE